MQEIIWTKVFLTVYPRLERLVEEFDNARENLLKSGIGVYLGRRLTNEELFEKIIDVNYRRLGLINVKVLVDEGMRRLPQKAREVLQARYMDKSVNTYCEAKDVSKRTFFRRLDSATRRLGEVLISLGYDERKILLEYKNEPILIRIKERLELNHSKSS